MLMSAVSSAKVYLYPANMKVVDLWAELQKRGKLTSGLKGDLVNRLREPIAPFALWLS